MARNRTAAFLLMATLVGGPAFAQDKRLRIVVGFPPGASLDTMTRLVGERMRVSLNRPVVVENKPGAAGIVANETVKSAAADGTTLLMTPLATMVAYPHSYNKLSYDPFKDYVPVAYVASFQLAFGVSADVAAKTLGEYVAFAKQGGNKADFASAGAGSLPHFFGIMFGRTAGVALNHVPYRGTAPVIQALQAGEIPAAVLPIADIGAFAQSGRGRVLATSGGRRSPSYPDVPTFKESGYDIEGEAWYALFAPAGTPRDMTAALARAAIEAVRAADVRPRIEALGLEPTGLGPDDLARILKSDYDKWGPPIQASGFKSD